MIHGTPGFVWAEYETVQDCRNASSPRYKVAELKTESLRRILQELARRFRSQSPNLVFRNK